MVGDVGIVDILELVLVHEKCADIVTERVTGLDVATGQTAAVIRVFTFRTVDVTTQGPFGIHEVGIGNTQRIGLRLAADGTGQIGFEPQSEEVSLLNRTLTDDAVQGAIASANAEGAGRLFLDGHIDVEFVVGAPFGRCQGRFLKIARIHQVLLAAFQAGGTVQLPFRQPQFATHNLVARFGVSGNIDPFKIDQLPFFQIKGQINSLLFRVNLGKRIYVCKGIALIGIDIGQCKNIGTQYGAAEQFARFALEFLSQLIRGLKQFPHEADLAHTKLLTFRDTDRNLQGIFGGRHGDGRLADLDIDKAVVHVKIGDQGRIILQNLFLVGSGTGQPGEEPLFRSLHDTAQFAVAEGVVAVKTDRANQNLAAFVDLEVHSQIRG